MTRPSKILGFLTIDQNWDPSLIFVMIGAIAAYSVAYRFGLRRSKPVFSQNFSLPEHKPIDRKLILGAAIFGIGWGLGGFCPGAAIVATTTGNFKALIFASAML